MKGSWKAELDRKYNRLMNLCKAIQELDGIAKYEKEIQLSAEHFAKLSS